MTIRLGGIGTAIARCAVFAVAIFCSHTATAGTVGLLKDLAADEVIAGTDPGYLGVSGNLALLAGSVPGEQGRALFRTDGTANGTVRVNVAGIVDPNRVVTLGNRVLFKAYTNAAHTESQLWSSDGTDAGTTLVRSLGSADGAVAPLGTTNGRVYLCVGGAPLSGCELYITDGTAGGTLRLAPDRRAGPSIADAAGNLYFFSNDSIGLDPGLWVTDGTAGGTRALHTLAALGFEGLGPIAWVDAQNLYVNASLPGFERGLYRVNIASGAVVRLALNGFSSFAQNPVEMNGARYFLMDDRIWRSDGTPAGTIDLGPAVMPSVTHMQLARVGNRIVFARSDALNGMEMWATDGTPSGTQMLVDAAPGTDGDAHIVAAANDNVFFTAGEIENFQFWVTDGTPAGTRVIPMRGGGAYTLQGLSFFVTGAVTGNQVFLQATVLAQLPGGGVVPRDRLFRTDTSGTDVVDLSFAGTQIEVFGSRVLFSNWGDPLGNEPWISDGTIAGTVRIRDLAVTGQTDHSTPWVFTRVGARVFFGAQDRDHGRELWVTDGTAANTRRLTDANPGVGHSMPLDSRLEASGGLLYFLASTSLDQSDERLWRSDGTDTGTFVIGDTSAHAPQCGRWTAEYNGRTWFFARTAAGSLAALWSTDGTATGTRHEIDLPDEIEFLPACHLQGTENGIVFISGYPAMGATLWRTDGTAAGTIQLGDIVPASAGPGSPAHIATAGGHVYLLADDAISGREVWRTDGSPAGTTLVADLTVGADGAQTFGIVPFDTGVLFAYGSAPGTVDGLWRIATPGSTPVRIKTGAVGARLPAVGSRVYFTSSDAGTESLWITDGTVAGSRAVFSAAAGSTLPINQFAAGENFLFFAGPFDASGEQVWFTNGQTDGTHKLSNFAPGTFFMNGDWVVLNDRAIFGRDDNVHGAEPFIVVNQPPVAVADTATTTRAMSVLVNLRANDSDPDSAASIVTLDIVGQPANGTIVAEGAGYRYTPNGGFIGSDIFQYRLTDEFGAQSAAVTVTITVNAPPPPVGGGGGGGGGGGKKGGGAIGWLSLAGLLAALARRFFRWDGSGTPG
jgi:ELWxxDGT repeat protein